MKKVGLTIILLMSAVLLSGCGNSAASSDSCESIDITADNLFDYFEWTSDQGYVTDQDGNTEEVINHYLELKSTYVGRVDDSDVVVRVIYDNTLSEDGEEMESWPITAIVGIPSEDPVYSEVTGENDSVPEEVEITMVEGTINLIAD